jgi:hypothetical protein
VSERYSGILPYTSAVKRLMCVVQTRESCEVFSLWSCLVELGKKKRLVVSWAVDRDQVVSK